MRVTPFNILITILIIVSIPVKTFSQELNIVLESGFGSYSMQSLKEFNTNQLHTLPFKTEISGNFPMYWNYKPSIQYTFSELWTLGLICSYHSTGTRISRLDYSGEYILDNKIRSISPGILIEFHHPFKKFRVSQSNELGIEYSKLGLSEYLSINEESQKNAYVFTSRNLYFEPSFKVSYPVSLFRLGLGIGYLVDLKKGDLDLSDSDDLDQELILSNGFEVKAEWSGIRLEASLSFDLIQVFKRDTQYKKAPGN